MMQHPRVAIGAGAPTQAALALEGVLRAALEREIFITGSDAEVSWLEQGKRKQLMWW